MEIENCWETLGIEPTDDKKAIRRAYSKKVKTCKPDQDPEGFQALRDAYDNATWLADNAEFYDEDEDDNIALQDTDVAANSSVESSTHNIDSSAGNKEPTETSYAFEASDTATEHPVDEQQAAELKAHIEQQLAQQQAQQEEQEQFEQAYNAWIAELDELITDRKRFNDPACWQPLINHDLLLDIMLRPHLSYQIFVRLLNLQKNQWGIHPPGAVVSKDIIKMLDNEFHWRTDGALQREISLEDFLILIPHNVMVKEEENEQTENIGYWDSKLSKGVDVILIALLGFIMGVIVIMISTSTGYNEDPFIRTKLVPMSFIISYLCYNYWFVLRKGQTLGMKFFNIRFMHEDDFTLPTTRVLYHFAAKSLIITLFFLNFGKGGFLGLAVTIIGMGLVNRFLFLKRYKEQDE